MTSVALKLGIKETKEAVVYFLHAFKVGGEILEDEKITLSDAGSLWALLDGANDAFQDLGQLPAELKDLDIAEADELIDMVVTNYSFTNEKAKEIVEKALKALKANYEVYLLIRG